MPPWPRILYTGGRLYNIHSDGVFSMLGGQGEHYHC